MKSFSLKFCNNQLSIHCIGNVCTIRPFWGYRVVGVTKPEISLFVICYFRLIGIKKTGHES